MAELGAVTRALLAVARDVVDDRLLAERICRACVDGLDVDGAAMSILTATEARQSLCATDPTAELLEELQFGLNEGACIEAATTGVPVLVSDLVGGTERERWPVFASAVLERSRVRALFALPMRWGAVNLGVLDLYRCIPGPLSGPELHDLTAAADTAALMLLSMRTDPGDPDGGWLDHAVAHRAEIHQATGMVLMQLGIPAEEALARLRGYAFAADRLLIDVARDVVARRITFTEDMR